MKFARGELHKIVQVLKMAHLTSKEDYHKDKLEAELINFLLYQTEE